LDFPHFPVACMLLQAATPPVVACLGSTTIEYFAVPFDPRQAQPTTGAHPDVATTPYDPSAVPRHDIVVVDLAKHKLTVNGNAQARSPA
jgi:hypothetical protein